MADEKLNTRRRGFRLAGAAVVSMAALSGMLSGCANAQGAPGERGGPQGTAAPDGGPPRGERGWFGRGSPGGPDGHGGPPDPARAERFLGHGLDRVGASAEQKDKVLAIARQAMEQLRPFRERMRDNRRQGVQVLTAPQIDRVALEGMRVVQLKDFEASSAIVSKAMLDAAEVLTPEQRAKLREHLERRGGRGRWG